MATIYCIRASVGEWSDRKEWLVVAYADETMAQAHVELATARAREWEALDWDVQEDWRDAHQPDYTEPMPWSIYDAGFRSYSSSGPRYRIEPVMVATTLPGAGAEQ